MDLYQPIRDSNSRRPLVIWMHGGGFKFGSKSAKGIRMWSRDFAKRGYVCAAVNYRLSKKNPLKNFTALVQGCYQAIEDIQLAVAFFKSNYTEYRIDTSHIILAGNSAGAIIALHAVYSNYSDLGRLIDSGVANPHSKKYNPGNIAAIINFWGALFDPGWMNNENVPIVSAHGKKDRIIPYNHKDSPLYGSYAIHQKADSLGIPNRLKTFDHFGHELQKHFIPILRSRATRRRWMEASQFATNFLYDSLLGSQKP